MRQEKDNIIISVRFWLNNLSQEYGTLNLEDVKNLVQLYNSFVKSAKPNKEKSDIWFLCPLNLFEYVKRYYQRMPQDTIVLNTEEYLNIEHTDEEKKDTCFTDATNNIFFTIPKSKDVRKKYFLSPKAYACLRLLLDLEAFYKTFTSNKLKFSVEFTNININTGDNSKKLVCSSDKPSCLFP